MRASGSTRQVLQYLENECYMQASSGKTEREKMAKQRGEGQVNQPYSVITKFILRDLRTISVRKKGENTEGGETLAQIVRKFYSSSKKSIEQTRNLLGGLLTSHQGGGSPVLGEGQRISPSQRDRVRSRRLSGRIAPRFFSPAMSSERFKKKT